MRYQVESRGDQSVLRLSEEITMVDRVAFTEAADAALEGGVTEVVADLAELEYMDSAGLGFLLMLLKAAEGKGASVTLTGVGGAVAEHLELARFNLLFPIEKAA